MALLGSSNPNSLPGIVTDQPEIFESEPALSDDTGINDLDLINNEPTDDAIALIEVPIKQAFSYFAKREDEIAKFYVQRYGEYKISSDKPEEETDIEKYHRLVSEVNELLEKFHTKKSSKLEQSEQTTDGSLSSAALTNNLEVLSKQLKTLELAANDGSLNATNSEFKSIESKLSKLEEKVSTVGDVDIEPETSHSKLDKTANLIRMSALERRLNLLETLLGHNETRAQTLYETTNCGSLIEVAETLGSWLSLFKPENVQRVSRELDYLNQRMESMKEQSLEVEEGKLDNQERAKLNQLCSLVTVTDKYRAMVPTIIHRLNAMEELQQKAAQIATTVNYLEQVQAQIVDSLQSNKDELSSLNEMFGKNLELIKDFSSDIDTRISNIRNRNQ